ncbi:glycosyltransferase family 4 protein [Cyclobacterium salsum]|uniref:glycosyltransferase family 4 protein n=1 Tax=Cyclobacterium salsum TaxID=2666329 RepID=UPI001390963D|nr:glycosyltransferase family 4 protein [Cyclobacterium salsum]
MLIASHPTGNANSRAVVNGFYDARLLSEFHTAIAVFPGSILYRLGGIRPFSEVRRRSLDKKYSICTSTHPWRELGRLMAAKAGFTRMIQHETGCFCVDAVYRSLDQKIATSLLKAKRKGVNGIYSYEDGAFHSFNKAKELNLNCFYDLPIGYWKSARKFLEKERANRPEWADTLTGLNDSEEKLRRKDKELEMADRIFVASTFTAQTLGDFTGKLAPIHVIPYGFPPVSKPKIYSNISNRPLKLLFVGGLSQRKGIAQLFEAVEALGKQVELTIIGNKTGAPCAALDAALNKHRWIRSLPHQKILKEMRGHDVFVFPSLFEGFGLVITEAMSQGTPVITTERTAGPDIIDHGENGWIVEAGSTHALQSTLENLIHRPRLIEMAGSAAREAAKKRPWEVYGKELSQAILNHY